MEAQLEVLRREFDAGPGSFLQRLRVDLYWDRPAFERLTRTMLAYVGQRDAETPIPRWIAEGFWYLDWFVREWSGHDQFPRDDDAEYYGRAYERLTELAYWLFVGESPHQLGTGFAPLSAAGR